MSFNGKATAKAALKRKNQNNRIKSLFKRYLSQSIAFCIVCAYALIVKYALCAYSRCCTLFTARQRLKSLKWMTIIIVKNCRDWVETVVSVCVCSVRANTQNVDNSNICLSTFQYNMDSRKKSCKNPFLVDWAKWMNIFFLIFCRFLFIEVLVHHQQISFCRWRWYMDGFCLLTRMLQYT